MRFCIPCTGLGGAQGRDDEEEKPLRDSREAGPSPVASAWAKQDNRLVHGPIFLLKERIQCFFEGGKACKKEDPYAQKGENAVRGIHSNWVGDAIVAAARPQQPIIEREESLKDLLSKNVRAVFNLQEIGEHAHCGSGVLKHTGFSYDPDYFMKAGISVYTFPSVDMHSPGMGSTLNVVQVMDFHIKRKEAVLVHCHAGLGRTGTAIACYFVFAEMMSPKEAIALVRKHRPKSVETRSQIELVNNFARFLDTQCKHFPLSHIKEELGRTLETVKAKLSGKEKERALAHAGKLSDRIDKIAVRRERTWGSGASPPKKSFEAALHGQETLLHGAGRKHHPQVLWKLSQALCRLRRSQEEKESIADEAARIVSGLLSEETRFISLEVLDIEVDIHCSKWQGCEFVSLSQALQLIDEWLKSIRTDGFDPESTERLLTESLSSRRGSKKALLDRYQRQHALTIYALAVTAGLLIGTAQDGGVLTVESEERSESTHAILEWMVTRLLSEEGGGDAVTDISKTGERVKLSELILKLSSRVVPNFSAVEAVACCDEVVLRAGG
ncbi:protein tyrosine phosphatase [Chloropicon primus]|uniref:Protein tyrosine phosphatase n=2 Tax=Chloropicon primus TaxID=1764295 RepID=A0A5B8MM20_9CHLO|nr:protein tyrosine phosphatase [Chloropicon primus]UPR00527.1 protein tyrosine phosphatase [Chloropicon primus]|eukprot:QDZ21311.1 protein tyrosine phosphatase [Chloropicon primus]